jgi:hypothetical protein
VQTFLPYPDLTASCVVLDDRRLGKQRVETFQVLRALTWPEYAWKSHPAVRMWRGFVPGLVRYGVESCREWTRRGYADSVLPQLLAWSGGEVPEGPELPPWFGVEELHRSHRSSLVRKDPEHYLPLLGPHPDEPYLWPPDTFPRWPVRAAGPLDADAAARLLGLPGARPEQEAAVAALQAGRDVLAVVAPGAGGRSLGLVAGLATSGSTLWRQPRPGRPATATPPDLPLPAWREVAPAAPAVALARPPSPVDAVAMAEEASPSAWLFREPGWLVAADRPGADRPGHDVGLVVDLVTSRGWPVELAAQEPDEDLPRPDRAPLLVVAEEADPATRAAIVGRHGLRDPLRVGAGWDPASDHLAARPVASEHDRRRQAVELVGAARPALVVCAGRDRADRMVAALAARGLRAASWDPRMRAGRAQEAVAAWRSRRLAALVVAEGADPPLGRVQPALLLHADPPASALAWREDVVRVGAPRAELLVPRAAPQDLQALLSGCVRVALLEPLGEPVPVPCRGCSGCAPAPYPDEPAVSAGAAAGRSARG